MKNKERRVAMMQLLAKSDSPLSGGKLAEMYGVTRPIIVGDIAALRQSGYPIASTPRGYKMISPHDGSIKKVFLCKHGREQVEEELTTILSLGGIVHTIGVEHDIYGNIEASLYIQSMEDCRLFVKRFKESQNQLLSSLSHGIHTHLVEAPSLQVMEQIEGTLRDKGLLVS